MKHKPIVAFGDSITRGHTLKDETTWPHYLSLSLTDRLGPSAPEVFNAGGNGNTTRDGLARIQADVLDKKPGLVLVEFGGNDAGHNPIDYPDKHVTLQEFERNLRHINDLVANADGRVVFVTFPPVIEALRPNGGKHPFFESAGGPDAFIGIYRQATRKAARELGRPLFDLELFIHEQINNHGLSTIMDNDGVHLTIQCNQMIAAALLPRVLEWLGETRSA